DRTVLFRLPRLRRRRRPTARSLRVRARSPSSPLFCQSSAGADDRRAPGDIADHKAKPQPRIARTRRQELRGDPSWGLGSSPSTALCDAGRRAPGAQASSGSDAAVCVGVGTTGRLGSPIGASLSQSHDRSPEGAERCCRPRRTDEAGRSGAVSSPPTSLADDAAHVLVVDDDRRLRALLSSYLVKHGHRVTVAPTAAKARAFLDGLAFDIIVLDVMMPVENGFDFAADLRTRSQVPILMLTARGEPQDRVRGLEIGVDDYLAKPFEPRELLLRIGSVLRRTRAPPAGSPETAVVRFGRFAFSLERGELRAGDDPVRITEREREMLRLLSANPGAIVSREALSGSGGAAQERTVDVLVNRLRRKIEQDPTNPIYLQTARGAGYRPVAARGAIDL